MARLPQPGGDSGNWGVILNDYLSQAHDSDGTLKANSIDATAIVNGTISETLLDTDVQTKLNASSPDATASTAGVIRLAGDLSGSAVSPTVPALANKVSKNELMINVRDFGALGDGSTDDSAAFAAALAAGDEVFVPVGNYVVGSTIAVPTGKHLRGAWSSIYTSTPTWGARLRRIGAASTAPVISLGVNAKISEIAIVGGSSSSAAHNGILCGGRNVIRDVMIANCLNGIDGDYKGVIRIDNCQIHDNVQAGILNIVDSIVTNSYLNVNKTHGINLQTGANDNVIANNKLEWNTGHGVQMFQTTHNIVTSNNIDRNGRTGISAVSSTKMVLQNNIIRRNGRLSSGTANDDTHFYLQSCDNSMIVGNVTEAGENDGGGGYLSPATSVRIQDGTNNNFISNDLGGSTGSPVSIISGGSTNRYALNVGYGVEPYVDVTTNQTIGGSKTFSGNVIMQAATRFGYTLSTSTSLSLSVSNTMDRMVDASAGNVTVTLPGTTLGGLQFVIKKVDSSVNTVTINGIIDGVSGYVLSAQYSYVHIISSQTSGTWYIVGKN